MKRSLFNFYLRNQFFIREIPHLLQQLCLYTRPPAYPLVTILLPHLLVFPIFFCIFLLLFPFFLLLHFFLLPLVLLQLFLLLRLSADSAESLRL